MKDTGIHRKGSGYAFDYQGSEYQIIMLPSVKRVQIWVRIGGVGEWIIGHGRDISDPQRFADVASLMYRFITRQIDNDTYNATEL